MAHTALTGPDTQEVLAFLSHELKNPLTVILANTMFLLRENKDDPRLIVIREGAERAAALLDGFTGEGGEKAGDGHNALVLCIVPARYSGGIR